MSSRLDHVLRVGHTAIASVGESNENRLVDDALADKLGGLSVGPPAVTPYRRGRPNPNARFYPMDRPVKRYAVTEAEHQRKTFESSKDLLMETEARYRLLEYDLSNKISDNLKRIDDMFQTVLDLALKLKQEIRSQVGNNQKALDNIHAAMRIIDEGRQMISNKQDEILGVEWRLNLGGLLSPSSSGSSPPNDQDGSEGEQEEPERWTSQMFNDEVMKAFRGKTAIDIDGSDQDLSAPRVHNNQQSHPVANDTKNDVFLHQNPLQKILDAMCATIVNAKNHMKDENKPLDGKFDSVGTLKDGGGVKVTQTLCLPFDMMSTINVSKSGSSGIGRVNIRIQVFLTKLGCPLRQHLKQFRIQEKYTSASVSYIDSVLKLAKFLIYIHDNVLTPEEKKLI